MELKLTEPETREYLNYLATRKIAWREKELLDALSQTKHCLNDKQDKVDKIHVLTTLINTCDEIDSLREIIQEYYRIRSYNNPTFAILSNKPVRDALIRATKSSIRSYSKFISPTAQKEVDNLTTALEILLKL